VAGRVEDVDSSHLDNAPKCFGHNGDAALALEIHRIHHALAHLFVIAKVRIDGACVDQSGLAVIYVGNNRDISDVFLSSVMMIQL